MLRAAVSRATLFCRSSPTEPGQSPRSPVSIRQGGVVLMGVVEKKEAKRRARITPGKIELQREKPQGSNKLRGSLPYFVRLVRWNERRHRKCPVIFSHFQSCWALLLFQTRWVKVKEVFLLSITWFACNFGAWRGCTDNHVSVGTCLTDLTITPAHQTDNTAQAWSLRLCCIRALLIEDSSSAEHC